jgi:DNA-binding response OmpR family regulator
VTFLLDVRATRVFRSNFMMPTYFRGEFPAAVARSSPRVLVVDNEPLVRWSLATGLRLSGFDAGSAADAAEARGLARQGPPLDAVLLDARLWDADPRALLAEIRATAPHCRFLILAVAGQDVDLAAWDAVAMIRKPFDLHDVVHRVQTELTCTV